MNEDERSIAEHEEFKRALTSYPARVSTWQDSVKWAWYWLMILGMFAVLVLLVVDVVNWIFP